MAAPPDFLVSINPHNRQNVSTEVLGKLLYNSKNIFQGILVKKKNPSLHTRVSMEVIVTS